MRITDWLIRAMCKMEYTHCEHLRLGYCGAVTLLERHGRLRVRRGWSGVWTGAFGPKQGPWSPSWTNAGPLATRTATSTPEFRGRWLVAIVQCTCCCGWPWGIVICDIAISMALACVAIGTCRTTRRERNGKQQTNPDGYCMRRY